METKNTYKRTTKKIPLYSNKDMEERGLKTGEIEISNSRSSIEISAWEIEDYVTKTGELKDRIRRTYLNIPARGLNDLKEVIEAFEASSPLKEASE